MNARFFIYAMMVMAQVFGSLFGFGSVTVKDLFSIPAAQAAEGISHTINYQGKLMNSSGATVANGNYNIKFTVYDSATGGNQLWSASTTNGLPTGTSSTVSVAVTSGLFTILLGDASDNQVAFPDSLFNNDALYLGVTIGSDSEMTPRKRLSAVPYAYNSEMLQGQYASSSSLGSDANLFALNQASSTSAYATRTALYIQTHGNDNAKDFLVRGNNGTSDVFSISRQGNVTTTGNLEINGTTIIGSATDTPAIFNGYVNSNFVPYTDNVYTLGTNSYRWKNLYATNVSSTNIDALGYVSTTSLYINGTLFTGSATPNLQQVTDIGAITTNAIWFAGATSSGNFVPSSTTAYNLGTGGTVWNGAYSDTSFVSSRAYIGTTTSIVPDVAGTATSYVDAGTWNPMVNGKVTIIATIKRDTAATNQYFVTKGNDATNNSYGLVVSTLGTICFLSYQTAPTWVCTTDIVPVGEWYVIAASFNTATDQVKIYFNGVLVQTGVSTRNIVDSTLGLNFGRQVRSGYEYPFDGKIAAVRLIGNVLSDEQVMQYSMLPANFKGNFIPGILGDYTPTSFSDKWYNNISATGNGTLNNVTAYNAGDELSEIDTTGLFVKSQLNSYSTSSLASFVVTGRVNSNLLPYLTDTYYLGNGTYRWKGISVNNVSSTNIDATGYVSTTNFYLNGKSLDKTFFAQNGNSFDAAAILGSNDNYSLSFEVANVTWATIGTTGELSLPGTVNGGVNSTGIKVLISNYDSDDTNYTYPIFIEDEDSIGTTTADFYIRSRGTALGNTLAYFQGDVEIGGDANNNKLLTITGHGDTGISLIADAGDSAGTDNPYIIFNQDGTIPAGVNGSIGLTQVNGYDARNAAYTNALADSFLLGFVYNGFTQFGTNNTVRLTVDGSGNVGMGTTAPLFPLNVVMAGTNKDVLLIQETTGGAGNSSTIAFKTNSGNGTDSIQARIGAYERTNYNADLFFEVSGDSTENTTTTEAMRIQYNGNVGIGDSTPESMLTIGDGDAFQVSSTGNIVKINSVTSSWPSLQGAASTYLKNDGAGNFTWETISASAIPNWQQVTDSGATTTNWIKFYGASSTGNLNPSINNTYNLGTFKYSWRNIYASSTAYIANINSSHINVTNVSSTNIDASSYLSTTDIYSNFAILGNATTTNWYSPGMVSTTELYVNGVEVTGIEVQSLQDVTNIGAVTTNRIQFAGATSSGDLRPQSTLTYSLGSSSNRWQDVWGAIMHVGTSTWDLRQEANGALSIEKNNKIDEFNNNSIESFWTISNPTGGYSESGTHLTGSCPGACDWYSGANESSPIIYRSLGSGNFTATTKIDSYTGGASTNVGLTLYTDRNNAINWVRNTTGFYAWNMVSDVGSSIGISGSDTSLPLWLRMRRVGTTIYFEYSTNGDDFIVSGSYTQPFSPTNAGMFVKSWSGGISADFDYFELNEGATQVKLTGTGRILPGAINAQDIGSFGASWKNAYASGTIYGGELNVSGTSTLANVIPHSNNSYNLGSLSKSWKNIYASGTIYGRDMFIAQNGSGATGNGSMESAYISGIGIFGDLLDFQGMTRPNPESPFFGEGRIYFDSVDNKFYISENGSDFSDLRLQGFTDRGNTTDNSIIITATTPTHVASVVDAGAMELVGATEIEVVDNFAYVTASIDDGVSIFNVADPSKPVHVGSISDDGTTRLDGAYGIEVSGKYAYITSGVEDGMEILDISNRETPVHVGSLTKGDVDPRKLAVVDNYAYIPYFTGDSLDVVNISDPANPAIVGSIADASGPNVVLDGASAVVVHGKYAYVAAYTEGGLEILDISEPSNPTHVGYVTSTLMAGAIDIYVNDNYAFITGNDADTLTIVDISRPSAPSIKGTITDTVQANFLMTQPVGVTVSGNYAFVVSNADNAVNVIDISSPATPVFIASIQDAGAMSLGGAFYITQRNKYLYVAGYDDDGFTILETSTFKSPTAIINKLSTDDLFVANNISISSDLFVVGGIYMGSDLTVGNNLRVNGNTIFNGVEYSWPGALGSNATVLTTDGSGSLTWGNNAASLQDVTDVGYTTDNPIYQTYATPTFVGLIRDDSQGGTAHYLNQPLTVEVVGNIAYVISYADGALSSFDLSDPTNPVELDTLTDGGSTRLYLSEMMEIDGDYAYIMSEDNSLEIVDISDPYNLTHVGSVGVLAGWASAIAAGNGYVYLAQDYITPDIAVIDVSDPTAPVVVKTYTASGSMHIDNPNNMEVDGNYLYVAAGASQAVSVLDVSDPYNVFETDYLSGAAFNSPRGLAYNKNYIYSSNDSTDCVNIINKTDPANIFISGTICDSGNAYRELDGASNLEYAAGYLYVFSQVDNGIAVIDVTSSTKPTYVASLPDTGSNFLTGSYLADVAISDAGLLLQVDDETDTLHVFEIPRLVSPAAEISTLSTQNFEITNQAKFSGKVSISEPLEIKNITYAFPSIDGNLGDTLKTDSNGNLTWDKFDDLKINSITRDSIICDNDSPNCAAAYKTAITMEQPYDVFVRGDYAYIPSYADNGLEILDVSDSKNPKHVSSIVDATFLTNAEGVFVSGDYAYVSCQADFTVVDVSDVSKPTIVSNLTSSQILYARTVYVSGKYAYITGESSNDRLTIIDISNPASPYIVGSVAGIDNAWDVEVLGNYAYVTAEGSDRLYIIDISNPANPQIKSYLANGTGGALLDGARGVDVVGKYAYVTAYNSNALNIIDISSSTEPVVVGVYSTTYPGYMGYADDIMVEGNYAYIAAPYSDYVTILDISSSTKPTYVTSYQGSVSTMDVPDAIYAANGKLYAVGNANDSLLIFDISTFTAPSAQIGDLSATNFTAYNDAFLNNDVYISGGMHAMDIFSEVISGDNLFARRNIYASGTVMSSNMWTIKMDANNPNTTSVTESASISIGSSCYGAGQVQGNYYYHVCGAGSDAFKTVDVTNPSNPVYISSLALTTSSYALKVKGNYAYSVDADGNVQVINVSNPGAPVQVNSIITGGTAITYPEVQGNYLYYPDKIGQNSKNI